MTHDFAPKLARVLTEYCRPVQPGDYVLVMASVAAEPLVEALWEQIVKKGGNPSLSLSFPSLGEIFMKHATEAQFDFIDPALWTQFEKADVLYSIRAPTNTNRFSRVPAARMARQHAGQRPLIERYLARCENDDIRWNITGWPTQAGAQDAEMGLLEYTEFMYCAAGLDRADPVAYWQEFQERQAVLVEWLKGKQHAEIHGPGIEMSFDFGGRSWVSCHGIKNFPDGEIFTAPVEDSVNGTVEFNFPTVYGGRELNGVRLVFEQGCVVEAHAEKGDDYLQSQLQMDEGAKRLGEFAIGTNRGIQEFTREILFDEKIGGTIHMALGEQADGAGGLNKSAIHWDMVHNMKDGGEVIIDGELFYRSGEFMV